MIKSIKVNKLLYTMHIMWYEYQMINETLDSVEQAIKNAIDDVDIILCLNSQTYIEKPEDGFEPEKVFDIFLNHPVLKNATIIRKTDQDSFYNIGDWRRDIYGDGYDYKYIVWGESDCLVPEDHFYLLQHIDLDHPHIVSLATRKMWDDTWNEIEHPWINEFPRNGEILGLRKEQAPIPYNCGDYITLEELNKFNSHFEPTLIKLSKPKVDGNMTSLSKGLPYPYLPTDLHFAREDYCLEMFFAKKDIPQYHLATRLKGHNTAHPKKRIGTNNKKQDSVYKEYEQKAYESIIKFIKEQ